MASRPLLSASTVAVSPCAEMARQGTLVLDTYESWRAASAARAKAEADYRADLISFEELAAVQDEAASWDMKINPVSFDYTNLDKPPACATLDLAYRKARAADDKRAYFSDDKAAADAEYAAARAEWDAAAAKATG